MMMMKNLMLVTLITVLDATDQLSLQNAKQLLKDLERVSSGTDRHSLQEVKEQCEALESTVPLFRRQHIAAPKKLLYPKCDIVGLFQNHMKKHVGILIRKLEEQGVWRCFNSEGQKQYADDVVTMKNRRAKYYAHLTKQFRAHDEKNRFRVHDLASWWLQQNETWIPGSIVKSAHKRFDSRIDLGTKFSVVGLRQGSYGKQNYVDLLDKDGKRRRVGTEYLELEPRKSNFFVVKRENDNVGVGSSISNFVRKLGRLNSTNMLFVQLFHDKDGQLRIRWVRYEELKKAFESWLQNDGISEYVEEPKWNWRNGIKMDDFFRKAERKLRADREIDSIRFHTVESGGNHHRKWTFIEGINPSDEQKRLFDQATGFGSASPETQDNDQRFNDPMNGDI